MFWLTESHQNQTFRFPCHSLIIEFHFLNFVVWASHLKHTYSPNIQDNKAINYEELVNKYTKAQLKCWYEILPLSFLTIIIGYIYTDHWHWQYVLDDSYDMSLW